MIDALVILLPLVLTVLLLALGVPVFVSLGFGILATLHLQPNFTFTLFSGTMFSSLASFPLIAVPVYILVGDLIAETGMAQKLFNLSESLLGGIRSSMGTVTVASCGLFSMISGSNASDAATIGRITLGPLQEKGYPASYSAALVAAGGSTGILIPPSIMYIIAGTVLEISASQLFLAALIPGFLILMSIIATNILLNRINGYEHGGNFSSPATVLQETWDAKWALSIPVIILGGIYSGVFTPTESAAVAVFVAVVIGFVSGTLHTEGLPVMLERSALVNGIIGPNVAVGILLGELFAAYDVPQMLVSVLTSVTTGYVMLLVILTVFLLLAGMVLETAPNIIILGPLLMPIVSEMGIDPIHFTVYLVTALGVGFITPPIGINLFVMSGISGIDLFKIGKQAAPFTIAMFITTMIIAFVPELSLWLL